MKLYKKIIIAILFVSFIAFGLYLRVQYPTMFKPGEMRQIYTGETNSSSKIHTERKHI